MSTYCQGVLTHIEDQKAQRTPDLEEMVVTRRASAGVSPLYHLVEYAHELDIPDIVFENPIIKEMQILGIDLVSMYVPRLSALQYNLFTNSGVRARTTCSRTLKKRWV